VTILVRGARTSGGHPLMWAESQSSMACPTMGSVGFVILLGEGHYSIICIDMLIDFIRELLECGGGLPGDHLHQGTIEPDSSEQGS